MDLTSETIGTYLTQISTGLLALAAAAALLSVLWSVIRYFALEAGDPQGLQHLKKSVVNTVVMLFVVGSVTGVGTTVYKGMSSYTNSYFSTNASGWNSSKVSALLPSDLASATTSSGELATSFDNLGEALADACSESILDNMEITTASEGGDPDAKEEYQEAVCNAVEAYDSWDAYPSGTQKKTARKTLNSKVKAVKSVGKTYFGTTSDQYRNLPANFKGLNVPIVKGLCNSTGSWRIIYNAKNSDD